MTLTLSQQILQMESQLCASLIYFRDRLISNNHISDFVSVIFLAIISAGLAVDAPQQCGGVLKNSSGLISSPSYPGQYPEGSYNCTWKLTNNSFIWIKELILNPGDSLLVYNGSSSQTLIHNFTGKQDFGVVYSSANNTEIVFVSRNVSTSVEGRRFQLVYNTKECILDVHQPTTILSSPYFIQSTSSIKCLYNVNISIPRQIIDLIFVNFHLIKGQVTVMEGNVTLATYTNNDAKPADVISSTDVIAINLFLSTLYEQNLTMVFSKLNKDCFTQTHTKAEMNVTSSNFPNDYDNDLDCLWIITSPANSTLRLEFTELSLADANDRVIIKDGASALSDNIGVFSAGSPFEGIFYLTSSNVTWIQFKTDQFLKARGFKLIVTPQAYGQRFVNSGQFTVGILPNHTHSNVSVLPSSDTITYQFVAPENNQVYLVLGQDAVILPKTSIKCYDGFSPEDGLIGFFTSVSAFHPVFSNGNKLLVEVSGFLYNGTLTQQYLSGSFTSVNNDGTLLNSITETGALTLTLMENLYPWNVTWLIHNYDADEVISLKLHLVSVGVNSSVLIYQGLSDQSWLLTKMNTSAVDVPEIFIPKYVHGTRLVYQTNHKEPNHTLKAIDIRETFPDIHRLEGSKESKERVVLKATYTLRPDCKVNLTDQSGSILTPYYPGLYPYNAICQWTINTAQNKMLHLTFNTFDLAASHELVISAGRFSDYNLTLSDPVHFRNVTVTNLGIFRGHSDIDDIISSSNDSFVDLKFSSSFDKNPEGGVIVARGLNISYEVIDCGGNLTEANATLSVPGTLDTTKDTVTCMWIISLPNTSHANGSVNIISFTFRFEKTNSSSLVIRDGASSTSESIPLNATQTGQSDPVLSRSDKLWVRYTFPANSSRNGHFQLNYSTYVCPKSQQCNNSICMHADWRCNGRDDCGDGSDEDGCTYSKPQHTGYSAWALAVAIIATFIIAVLLTLAFLVVYRRCRYSNYNELRDLMAPIPT